MAYRDVDTSKARIRHYQDRIEEITTALEGMLDEGAKRGLMMCLESYEQMILRHEEYIRQIRQWKTITER